MNYWMSWKINILISLLILIEGCICCQVTTDRPIGEVIEVNKKTPWMVIVSDVTTKPHEFDGLSAECYGSLIHEKLVLTSAYPLANKEPKNLEVMINITSDSGGMKYRMRRVRFITDSSGLKNEEESIDDWAILTLKKPFILNDRINVINLAGGDDKFNENCKIYHWQIVTSYSNPKERKDTAMVHYPYNLTLNEGEFKLREEEIAMMGKDLDCVVSRCVEDRWAKKLRRHLSFMGTPIVCPLEDGTPVQVGLSTIVYEIDGEFDDEVIRYHSGGFVRFLNDKEMLMDFAIDALINMN